jgi:hypothetical protein
MARITIEISDEAAARLLHLLHGEKGTDTNGAPASQKVPSVGQLTDADPMRAAWGAFADVPEEDWQEFLATIEAYRHQQDAQEANETSQNDADPA